MLGTGHLETLRSIEKVLSIIYNHNRGNWRLALKFLRELVERALGSHFTNPEVVAWLTHLGLPCEVLGRMDLAVEIWRDCLKALSPFSRTKDKDKEILRDVHLIKRLLANYLLKLNNYNCEEAILMLREVYQEAADVFGHDDPATMTAMESLAANLNMGDGVAEALQLFLELEKLHSKIYGKENIYTIVTQGNIANTLSGMKNGLEEAIMRLHEAIGVASRVLGPDHSVTKMLKISLEQLQYRLRMENRG